MMSQTSQVQKGMQDIGTDLHEVDERLTELSDSKGEAQPVVMSQSSTAAVSVDTPRDDVDRSSGDVVTGSADDSATTLNDTSMTPPEHYAPGFTGEKSCSPTRPEPPPRGRGSNIIQVRKEVKRSWYRYPRDGYRVTTRYMYQEIDSSWTVAMLVACFFIAGLVDACTFGVYNVFVAMQTGQPSTYHPLSFYKSLASIICYCIGALVFNSLHRAPTQLSDLRPPLHRWTLLTSFVIQAVLILVTASLAQTGILSDAPYEDKTFSPGTATSPGDNYLDLIGICLLAFEAAGQVCLSRVLLVNELPTIVLSTLYHDLIAESLSVRRFWRESETTWDFMVTQKRQIRRFICIICLFAGALIGGFIFQSKGGLAAALWLAGGLKLFISAVWCFWKEKIATETTA